MVCYSRAEAWFFGGRTLTYRNESNLLIYHGSSLYYNPAAARAKNIKNKKDLVQDREHLSHFLKICSSKESDNLLIYYGSSLYYNPAAARAKKNKKDLVWDYIPDDRKS